MFTDAESIEGQNEMLEEWKFVEDESKGGQKGKSEEESSVGRGSNEGSNEGVAAKGKAWASRLLNTVYPGSGSKWKFSRNWRRGDD